MAHEPTANFFIRFAVNGHPLFSPTSAEERAILLIQKILGIPREKAEHTFMLIEANLNSIRAQDG